MKRRTFIKDTLTGLPIVVLAPTLLTACSDDNPTLDKKVIVIGAGVSGLAAAKKLKESC